MEEERRKNDIVILKKIEHLERELINGERPPAKRTIEIFHEVNDCLNAHIRSQSVYEEKTSNILKEQSEMLETIQKDIKEIMPSYRMIKNLETTGSVLTKFGKFLLWIVGFSITIIGAVVALKSWIKN
jgi:hypothetical protein